jgi:hypothetical protein
MNVYLINPNHLPDKYDGVQFSEISNEDFKEICVKFGEVYSYNGFLNACIHDEHKKHTDFYIRVIE